MFYKYSKKIINFHWHTHEHKVAESVYVCVSGGGTKDKEHLNIE